jgi:hypothetical protein
MYVVVDQGPEGIDDVIAVFDDKQAALDFCAYGNRMTDTYRYEVLSEEVALNPSVDFFADKIAWCVAHNMQMLQHKFHDMIIEAAKCRENRTYVIVTPAGEMVGWAWYETDQLLLAVNDFRKNHGRTPIHFSEIVDAEHRASVRADYADRLAWSCAELALKDWTTSLTY